MSDYWWKEKYNENKKILDALDLPKPNFGEELRDYLYRIEEQFKDVELPEDYCGDMIAWLDMEGFGEYLAKRFDMKYEEDMVIKYYMY